MPSENWHRWWKNFKAPTGTYPGPKERSVRQACPHCSSSHAKLVSSEGLYKTFRCEKCGKTYKVGKKG